LVKVDRQYIKEIKKGSDEKLGTLQGMVHKGRPWYGREGERRKGISN